MSELEELRVENARLLRDLADARQTIDGLKRGHIDAAPPDGPMLLQVAEGKLRRSEQLFRGVFDGALDAMLLIGSSGRCVDVNPAASELFGQSRDELIDSDPTDFYGNDFNAVDARAKLATVGWLRGELTLVLPNGKSRVAEFVTRTGIRPGLTLAVLRDITERKELEAQFRQAQKMEAIGVLAGGVAHDFNNLLSVILSYAEALMEPLDIGDTVRDDLAEVKKAGERAAALTRQLLAFSRKQLLRPMVLNLGEVLTGMEKMIRRLVPESVALALHAAPALGRVHADAGQIEQIVMNLVVNARDAMPRGGHLTVEATNADFDDAYTAAHVGVNPGPYVMLAVTDTGTGIDPAIRDRIFEPFFTTKEKGRGTGLGLSTVFGIVKQSGGHVWVYSELGKGTTFKIYLPRTEMALHPVMTGPPRAMARGVETLLLVEDDDQVRLLARTVLQRHGYKVLEAENGGAAMMACQKYEGRIDLLLTDVVMPGISGKQLAERLTPLKPEMKVLFMSGYTDQAIVHHGVLDAEIAFLQKPITRDALLRTVRQVLDGPR